MALQVTFNLLSLSNNPNEVKVYSIFLYKADLFLGSCKWTLIPVSSLLNLLIFFHVSIVFIRTALMIYYCKTYNVEQIRVWSTLVLTCENKALILLILFTSEEVLFNSCLMPFCHHLYSTPTRTLI